MTPQEARDVVCTVLRQVAPEADPSGVDPGSTLQESLGLDSLDFLDFVAGLHDRTGVEIAERDYPRLLTIDACVSYLVSATRPAPAPPPGQGARGGARGAGGAVARGAR